MYVLFGFLSGIALAGAPQEIEEAVSAARARVHAEPSAGEALVEQTIRWGGGTLVRFDRTLHGLPVHGAEVVASVGRGGEVRRIRGALGPVSATVPRPVVDGEQALRSARRVGERLGQGELWAPRLELAWWAPDPDTLRLSWVADLSTERPLATWRTWIDAQSGEILATERTSHRARGWVYPENPVVSEPALMELHGLHPDAEVLDGEYSWVRSCTSIEGPSDFLGLACDGLAHRAVADEEGDFLYPMTPELLDDPASEVQVYYHVDRVASYLDQRYGFRLPHAIQGITSFEMANAFYGDFDGDGLPDVSFGQDPHSGVDFAYDGDVVYHEFGHAVTARVARLPWIQADSWGMNWAGSGLNEGYADVLAMTLTGDPLLGEYAGSTYGGSAIRDLSVPRRCPENLPGQAHADGQVLGNFAWTLIQELGTGPTHDLIFGALAFWDWDVDWARVGQTLSESADDLLAAGRFDQAAHDRVHEVLGEMNLLGCERYWVLEPGEVAMLYGANLGLLDDMARIPAGSQLAVDIPSDATSLRLRIREFSQFEGMGWSVYLRYGEHVEHKVLALDGLGIGIATAETYDHMQDGTHRDSLRLTLDSDPPLVPGERLYIALASHNLGAIDFFDIHYAVFEVEAEITRERPILPEPLGFEGGGGCATTTGGSLGALIVGALGALLRGRRREDGADGG